MRRHIRVIVGLIAWGGGMVCAMFFANNRLDNDFRHRVIPRLLQYATGRRSSVALSLSESLDIRTGDPIFLVEETGELTQVGEIQHRSSETAPTALLYASAPSPRADDRLNWYATPDSMAWVASTLIPEAKRQAINAELQRALAAHHDEILKSLQPLVERSMKQSLAIVEAELPSAIQEHREEIAAITEQYQTELIDKDVLPLVRREIWPIVRRRAQPLVIAIGNELWQKVSVWGFTWRFLYDKTPLVPRRTKFRKEFERFVDREAVPILERHSGKIVTVVQQVIRDASANPSVRAAARQSVSKVLNDPALRRLLWRIVQQTAIENPKFRQALQDTWTGPDARDALAAASRRFEPTVRRIGELVIGTREKGITPEFAAVLRNQILGKDRRWLILERGEAEAILQTHATSLPSRTLTVVRGNRSRQHPFLARFDTINSSESTADPVLQDLAP